MAQKQLEFVDRAQKKVDKMVQKKTGMQQDFLSEEDRQEAYIAHQLKKAKTEEFLPSQNPTDPGLGFLFPDIPESQDVTGMELGLYNAQNQPPAMNKEDFAIITTTLDGIVNRINVLSDEIGTHTTVLMKKLEELTSKKPRKEYTPDYTSNPCYTCGETGHWSPDCPQKTDYPQTSKKSKSADSQQTSKKTKQKDPCYKCGKIGHWISECPEEQAEIDAMIGPVPGSKPTVKREYKPLEMWNPPAPIEEPPKKKKKLSKK